MAFFFVLGQNILPQSATKNFSIIKISTQFVVACKTKSGFNILSVIDITKVLLTFVPKYFGDKYPKSKGLIFIPKLLYS